MFVHHLLQSADTVVEDRFIAIGDGSKESRNRGVMAHLGERSRCVSPRETIAVLQARSELRHSAATSESPERLGRVQPHVSVGIVKTLNEHRAQRLPFRFCGRSECHHGLTSNRGMHVVTGQVRQHIVSLYGCSQPPYRRRRFHAVLWSLPSKHLDQTRNIALASQLRGAPVRVGQS